MIFNHEQKEQGKKDKVEPDEVTVTAGDTGGFPALEGINVEAGLKRLLNNRKTYEKRIVEIQGQITALEAENAQVETEQVTAEN